MRHSRIDQATLKAFGNLHLFFCAIALAAGAMTATVITWIMAAACYLWASLEVADE